VGNAYSALCCARWAQQHQAELLLRIEDIDHTRCRPEYTDALIEDLRWLGLIWDGPIQYQSQRSEAYMQAILKLRQMQVIYPCFCTRKEIKEELMRITSAPHAEDVISEYPGTCRDMSEFEQKQRMQMKPFAWRLDVEKALTLFAKQLTWQDGSAQQHKVTITHDIVIGRKDITFSYHLAVVVDDALQGITHIVRGNDLRDSTGIHRLLQSLLGLPEPIYIHHTLLCDSAGNRLAKRHGSMSLQGLRKIGVEAEKLRLFLCQYDLPVWPFEADDKKDILDLLGKTH